MDRLPVKNDTTKNAQHAEQDGKRQMNAKTKVPRQSSRRTSEDYMIASGVETNGSREKGTERIVAGAVSNAEDMCKYFSHLCTEKYHTTLPFNYRTRTYVFHYTRFC